MCWWDPQVRTCRDAFMGPESERTHIPDDPVEGDHLVVYGMGWAIATSDGLIYNYSPPKLAAHQTIGGSIRGA